MLKELTILKINGVEISMIERVKIEIINKSIKISFKKWDISDWTIRVYDIWEVKRISFDGQILFEKGELNV